jgi:hypothetical protein
MIFFSLATATAETSRSNKDHQGNATVISEEGVGGGRDDMIAKFLPITRYAAGHNYYATLIINRQRTQGYVSTTCVLIIHTTL